MAATKTTVKAENLSNNNLMIVMLLISLLAVGVSVLVGKSLVTTIVRDTTVVKKESAADKQLSSDKDAAPKLVDAYGQLNDKTKLVADALPTEPDFPSLIVTLENMAKTAGVTLKSVTPAQAGASSVDASAGATAAASTDTSVAPTPQSYKFGISFSGTYASLTKFLTVIETSARPMRVLDMQLAGGGSALSGQFDVETFYQGKAQLPFGKETVK